MMEFDLQGPLPGHLSKKTYLATQTTLVYLIAEHARLTFLGKFSTLLTLIRSCSLNYILFCFHPAPLIGSARLFF